MVKIPEDTDTIVNLSGGLSPCRFVVCKEKGYKPVCLALYNPNAKGNSQMQNLKLQNYRQNILKSR